MALKLVTPPANCIHCGPPRMGFVGTPTVQHIPALLKSGKPSISVNCPSCRACTKNYANRELALFAWEGGEQIPRSAHQEGAE